MTAYKDEKRGTWYVSFHYYDWTGQNKRKVKRGFKTRKVYQLLSLIEVSHQILHTDHNLYQTIIKKEEKYSHLLKMSFLHVTNFVLVWHSLQWVV